MNETKTTRIWQQFIKNSQEYCDPLFFLKKKTNTSSRLPFVNKPNFSIRDARPAAAAKYAKQGVVIPSVCKHLSVLKK